MPYPDDDSCPLCGHPSTDGRAHTACPWECPECDYLDTHEEGCKRCKVTDIYHKIINDHGVLDREELRLLKEVIDSE
jgi:hypothetical protein